MGGGSTLVVDYLRNGRFHLQVSIFLPRLPWWSDASCTLIDQLHGLSKRLFDKVLLSLHEVVNAGFMLENRSGYSFLLFPTTNPGTVTERVHEFLMRIVAGPINVMA